MRTGIRLAALAVALVGLVFWLFGGPHLGWTRTTQGVMKQDPVTEQEYVVWERRFVPGLDFLGACLAGAGGMFALSWLAPRRPAVKLNNTIA